MSSVQTKFRGMWCCLVAVMTVLGLTASLAMARPIPPDTKKASAKEKEAQKVKVVVQESCDKTDASSATSCGDDDDECETVSVSSCTSAGSDCEVEVSIGVVGSDDDDCCGECDDDEDCEGDCEDCDDCDDDHHKTVQSFVIQLVGTAGENGETKVKMQCVSTDGDEVVDLMINGKKVKVDCLADACKMLAKHGFTLDGHFDVAHAHSGMAISVPSIAIGAKSAKAGVVAPLMVKKEIELKKKAEALAKAHKEIQLKADTIKLEGLEGLEGLVIVEGEGAKAKSIGLGGNVYFKEGEKGDNKAVYRIIETDKDGRYTIKLQDTAKEALAKAQAKKVKVKEVEKKLQQEQQKKLMVKKGDQRPMLGVFLEAVPDENPRSSQAR
jgi:hypothetical protein